jgi:hypothetical protein
MFLIPEELLAGDYTLEVRAGFGEDDVRSGALDAPLTVSTMRLWEAKDGGGKGRLFAPFSRSE